MHNTTHSSSLWWNTFKQQHWCLYVSSTAPVYTWVSFLVSHLSCLSSYFNVIFQCICTPIFLWFVIFYSWPAIDFNGFSIWWLWKLMNNINRNIVFLHPFTYNQMHWSLGFYPNISTKFIYQALWTIIIGYIQVYLILPFLHKSKTAIKGWYYYYLELHIL